jgi:hypothetical protein
MEKSATGCTWTPVTERECITPEPAEAGKSMWSADDDEAGASDMVVVVVVTLRMLMLV